MAEEQIRRPLEFQISNNTQITLKYHRTKDDQSCSHLCPELHSGCSDSYHTFSSSNALGSGWLVIYEADSFTLAVFFFLPLDHSHLPKMLQLELSLDKAHLDQFDETFSRLTLKQDPRDPGKTTGSRAEFTGKSEVAVKLSAGSYAVWATVSRYARPLLRVELEERDPLWLLSSVGYPGPKRAISRTLQVLPEPHRSLWNLVGTSGTPLAPLEPCRNL